MLDIDSRCQCSRLPRFLLLSSVCLEGETREELKRDKSSPDNLLTWLPCSMYCAVYERYDRICKHGLGLCAGEKRGGEERERGNSIWMLEPVLSTEACE